MELKLIFCHPTQLTFEIFPDESLRHFPAVKYCVTLQFNANFYLHNLLSPLMEIDREVAKMLLLHIFHISELHLHIYHIFNWKLQIAGPTYHKHFQEIYPVEYHRGDC